MEIELSSGSPADLHPTIGAKRGVVLLPDLSGRRKLFDEMAASLAAANNWNVILVDPLADQEFTNDSKQARDDMVGLLNDDVVVGDMVDAANRLEVDPVGLIGFGLGGMYAFKAAASQRFDRLVSFYGQIRLPSLWRGTDQREPLDLLAHVEDRKHIFAVVGTDDQFVPAGDVDAMVELGVKVARYPGARHGFVHDPSLDEHRANDAVDAWSQVVAHLAVSENATPFGLA